MYVGTMASLATLDVAAAYAAHPKKVQAHFKAIVLRIRGVCYTDGRYIVAIVAHVETGELTVANVIYITLNVPSLQRCIHCEDENALA